MKHKNFGDFVNKKKRESVRQLGLVKQLLEKNGMKVENFTETDDEDDPYVFCYNPQKTGSFDGIRIYKIGDSLAFRIQKENKTHPYGSAYPLPIEDMFHDLLTDEGIDELKAGKKVIEAVNKEIRSFFDKSVKAEKDARKDSLLDPEQDRAGGMVRASGTDYSSLIYSKG